MRAGDDSTGEFGMRSLTSGTAAGFCTKVASVATRAGDGTRFNGAMKPPRPGGAKPVDVGVRAAGDGAGDDRCAAPSRCGARGGCGFRGAAAAAAMTSPSGDCEGAFGG